MFPGVKTHVEIEMFFSFQPQNRVGSPTKTTKKPPDEPLKAPHSDSDVDDPGVSFDSGKNLDCSDLSEPNLDLSSHSEISSPKSTRNSEVGPVKKIEAAEVKDVPLEALSEEVDLGIGKKSLLAKKGPSGSVVSSPTSNSDSTKSVSSVTRTRRAK